MLKLLLAQPLLLRNKCCNTFATCCNFAIFVLLIHRESAIVKKLMSFRTLLCVRWHNITNALSISLIGYYNLSRWYDKGSFINYVTQKRETKHHTFIQKSFFVTYYVIYGWSLIGYRNSEAKLGSKSYQKEILILLHYQSVWVLQIVLSAYNRGEH